MANKVRGEFDFTLDGKVYTCRPEFQAIATIEQSLGLGSFALGQKVMSGQAGIAEMATVIHHGIRVVHGRQKTPAIDKIGEHILTEGMQEYIGPVSEFLLRAFVGSKDRSSDGGPGEDPKPAERDEDAGTEPRPANGDTGAGEG